MQARDIGAVAMLCGQLGYPSTPADIERRWALIASNPSHAVLVACDGQRVVGWIHVAVRPLLEIDLSGEIWGLVVDEQSRGAGAGRSLVQAAERWAAGRGCAAMRVRSRVAREGAHAFYEREGYVRVKTQHVFEKTLG